MVEQWAVPCRSRSMHDRPRSPRLELLRPIGGPRLWRGRVDGDDAVVRFAPPEQPARARFATERRLLERLRSPDIVPLLGSGWRAPSVHDTPDAPSGFWIATAAAHGGSTLLHPPENVDRWQAAVRAVLRALAHLHARGWVHLDVAPTNILVHVGPNGPIWWLADLERARPLTGRGLASGAAGGEGTPEFAAPELDDPPACWTARVDVYAAARTARWWAEEAQLALDPAWEAWLERAGADDPATRFGDACEALATAPGDDAPAPLAFDELRDPLFSGRETELDALLARARADGLVPVTATSSGLGVSALLRAAIVRRRMDGSAEVWAATPARRPGGAAVSLREALGFALGLLPGDASGVVARLRILLPRLDDRERTRLARWLSPPSPYAPDHASRERVREGVSLLFRGSERPATLVVDHVTTDGATLAALEDAAQDAPGATVIVAGSEPRADAIELAPLDDRAAASLLEQGQMPNEACAEALREAHGHPERLHRALLQHAPLGGPGGQPLGALFDGDRRLRMALAVAAVFGATFERARWVEALTSAGTRGARALEHELVRRGVWDERPGDALAFARPETVGAVRSWAERDGLWRRVSATCAGLARPAATDADGLWEAARFAIDGGLDDLGASYVSRACRAAIALGRLRDARSWSEAAMRRWAGAPRGVEFELWHVRARRRLWEDLDRLDATLRRVAEAAEATEQDEILAGAAIERAHLAAERRDFQVALEQARLGVEVFRRIAEPEQLAYALAAQARALRGAGEADAALERYDEASARFREAGDLHSAGHCLLGRANTQLGQGALDEAASAYAEAATLLADDDVELANTWNGRGEIAMRRGELSEAIRCYEEAIALWRRSDSSMLGLGLVNRGLALVASGRSEEASQGLEEAEAMFRTGGRVAYASYARWCRVAAAGTDAAAELVQANWLQRDVIDEDLRRTLAQAHGDAWLAAVLG